MGNTHFYLVFSTFPAGDSARGAAEQLVRDGRAACVNIVPGVFSVYRWAGAVESSSEQLLIIKSRADVYQALQAALQELHPYELPAAPLRTSRNSRCRYRKMACRPTCNG